MISKFVLAACILAIVTLAMVPAVETTNGFFANFFRSGCDQPTDCRVDDFHLPCGTGKKEETMKCFNFLRFKMGFKKRCCPNGGITKVYL